jgi:hypothetical protein
LYKEKSGIMDLQTRKLSLIEEFIQITDESIIEKFEALIGSIKRKLPERDIKPMTMAEFHEMIDKSLDDSKNGRVISHDDLLEKVKSWK